jgi:hypothetical protein
MKLAISLSLAAAALVLAGPAGAQRDDHCPPPGSHASAPSDHGNDNWRDSEGPQIVHPGLPTFVVSGQAMEQLKIATPEMRLACAADRDALCADKKSQIAADRCLQYHRLSVSKPCRASLDRLQMAYEGRF